MKIFFGVVCFGALLFLAACGGNETATPTPPPAATLAPTRRPVVVPTLPTNWKAYRSSTFQIALPPNWQTIQLGESEIKTAIASAQENNPPLAEQLRVLLESGQYRAFVFYAVDTSAPNAPSVSIARLGLEGTNDLQAYAKSYAETLPNVVRGSKVIEVQSSVRVNGMDAASFVYDVSLVNTDGELTTLRGVQFLYVLESGDAYLVTVTGSASQADAFMPRARQIATSFVVIAP